jgi:hypothetical protein
MRLPVYLSDIQPIIGGMVVAGGCERNRSQPGRLRAGEPHHQGFYALSQVYFVTSLWCFLL